MLNCLKLLAAPLYNQLVPSDPSDGSAAPTCQTTPAALFNHSQHNIMQCTPLKSIRVHKAVHGGEKLHKALHSGEKFIRLQCSAE